MIAPRIVEPELLDSLPPDDPAAIHSRGDLRRLNLWMRNPAHVRNAILSLPQPPRTILEIGCGDGTFLLRIAAQLRKKWHHPISFHLLDMEPVVSSETIARFRELGFQVEVIKADLRDWVQNPSVPSVDLVLANLFLHHFQDSELRSLFSQLHRITPAFIACEPRRWFPALVATRLLHLIGCNHITRHDAIISVRAGFRERELTALWPSGPTNKVHEYPAGYASQVLVALRQS